MSDSIIAVVPATSDVETVQGCLMPKDAEVQFVNSFQEALRLLAEGSTPVFFCDEANHGSWQEPMLRMLQSGRASRVVLLSNLADDRRFGETPSRYSSSTITI
jgi:hypothetical protein